MNSTIGHLIRDLHDEAQGAGCRKLWVGSLPPDCTDEDLKAFLQKHGLPPCTTIMRVVGDGSHPGALLAFGSAQPEDLYKAALRLDGMYWKQRTLSVFVVQH